MKLAVCVTHTPWIPKRVETMTKLRRQLFELTDDAAHWREAIVYREETTRAPNYVWSELMWRWGSEQDATHVLFMQDDLNIPEQFWKWLDALVTGRPNDVIAFSSAHPAARSILLEGKSGYTTAEGLIGIAYLMPRPTLCDVIRWRENEIVATAPRRMSEDSLLGLYCMTRGIPIFHPVPSIVDHDLDADSTYGNDGHMYRTPQATWKELDRLHSAIAAEGRELDMLNPQWWAQEAPHVGRFYETLHHWLPLLLRDKALAGDLYQKYEEDRCPKKYEPYFLRVGVERA